MDYGLDMFFCLWVAVDEDGRCYVYREFAKPDMVVSDAARKQLEMTRPEERVMGTIAPPDMWARNRESGRTQAAAFADNGVGLIKASNNRIQGWSALKEFFKVKNHHLHHHHRADLLHAQRSRPQIQQGCEAVL